MKNKVYIVFYINSAYNDIIQEVFWVEEDAQKYIDKQEDQGNYYILLKEVL